MERLSYTEILEKLKLTDADDSYAGGFSTVLCKENRSYIYYKPLWTVENSWPAEDNGEDIITHPKIKEHLDEFFETKGSNSKICAQTKEFLDFCFQKTQT